MSCRSSEQTIDPTPKPTPSPGVVITEDVSGEDVVIEHNPERTDYPIIDDEPDSEFHAPEPDMGIEEIGETDDGPRVGASKSRMIKVTDGSEMSAPVRMAEMSSEGRTKPTDAPPGNNISPEAGQITASEWNDLNKWDEWKELLNDQDYNDMQAHWQLFPRTRYSLFVRNKYELPIQDARVDLIDDAGNILWKAKTDNAGKAELWADMNSRDKSFETVHARVTAKDKLFTIRDLQSINEGVNHLDIDMECRTSSNVDILFAVDATGSMGDEINFLQSELQDVIKRSMASNTNLKVRMGSVFYRDSTDSYVTRVEPLSETTDNTLNFIGNQSASGGGDYPEAVDAALDASLAQDWSEDAIARIIFLLLDAPPHHNNDVIRRIQTQVAEAAELGIKIIPITASGINRQTEFLMKFMAIATNGTYVFITDHSGIGNPHLDPVVKDYEVEKLNDLLVRLLYNYTKSNGCNANESFYTGIKIYPNPARQFVNVNLDHAVQELKILSNSGKLVQTKTNLDKGEVRIELSGLVDGIYTIQCTGDDTDYSYPLVVVNN